MIAARALTTAIQQKKQDSCGTYNMDNSFSNHMQQRPVLARRHTIQSMSTSNAATTPASLQTKIDVEKAESKLASPVAYLKPVSPCSPIINVDSKAYVGSFTQTNMSPHRRYASLKQKYTHTDIINLDNMLTGAPRALQEESTSCNHSSGAKKVNNNFNNEFYRLCSGDTFESENNLNGWTHSSNSSLQIQKQLHIQKLNAKEKQQQQQHERASNLTDHVNSLFDQWLVNSNLQCNESAVSKH